MMIEGKTSNKQMMQMRQKEKKEHNISAIYEIDTKINAQSISNQNSIVAETILDVFHI